MVTPEASSNLRKSSNGRGAEPEKEVFTEEISASTGRCMSAEMAVGTVITNVICHLSINFQKLSNTPSPRYPCGVGKTTCAPELTIAINIT